MQPTHEMAFFHQWLQAMVFSALITAIAVLAIRLALGRSLGGALQATAIMVVVYVAVTSTGTALGIVRMHRRDARR